MPMILLFIMSEKVEPCHNDWIETEIDRNIAHNNRSSRKGYISDVP
jgi:hypothetical protein